MELRSDMIRVTCMCMCVCVYAPHLLLSELPVNCLSHVLSYRQESFSHLHIPIKFQRSATHTPLVALG